MDLGKEPLLGVGVEILGVGSVVEIGVPEVGGGGIERIDFGEKKDPTWDGSVLERWQG